MHGTLTPIVLFLSEVVAAADSWGGEKDERLQHFWKRDSSSCTRIFKRPKMAVAWAPGCDIGLKSSLPFCNHPPWFECLVEDSGVTPPHSSVRWAPHQSGSQDGIFSRHHDSSAQGPPSSAARDDNAERLTTLSVLIRAPHSWLSAVTKNPGRLLRARRTDVKGEAWHRDCVANLGRGSPAREITGDRRPLRPHLSPEETALIKPYPHKGRENWQ